MTSIYIMCFVWDFPPRKIYRLAQRAFAGMYDDAVILKWLKTFYWRFFSQQFKRSCLPDGPKVAALRCHRVEIGGCPSDACVTLWQKELDDLG